MNLANMMHNSELDPQHTARLSQLLKSGLSQPACKKTLNNEYQLSEFEISLQVTFDSQQKVENISLASV